MKKTVHSAEQYWQLQTKKGNTTIISDSSLPSASEGRVYLYNTERDMIIEYDKAIVTPKLTLLDEMQTKQAILQFKKQWLVAKEHLMRIKGITSSTAANDDDVSTAVTSINIINELNQDEEVGDE